MTGVGCTSHCTLVSVAIRPHPPDKQSLGHTGPLASVATNTIV